MNNDPSHYDGVRSNGSTSKKLLAGARLGVPVAWERLVRLYAPLVASWCRQWKVSEQDVGDVLQEVFSAVATHLDRFRKERPTDTFRGWLRTIAHNKVIDHFKHRAGEPMACGGSEFARQMQQIPDVPASCEASGSSDDALLDSGHLDALLHQALESIRGEFHERTWLAFWGAVVEGRLTADIAADLGMTTGAVRVAKSRVLLRLRRELGDVPE